MGSRLSFADLYSIEKKKNDDAMREASLLATHLHSKYYAIDSPEFELCDTPAGVIAQIDNMISGMRRVSKS